MKSPRLALCAVLSVVLLGATAVHSQQTTLKTNRILHESAGNLDESFGANIPIPLNSHGGTGVPVDGKIYIYGGVNSENNGNTTAFSDRVFVYDIASDAWTENPGRLPYGINAQGSNAAKTSSGKIAISPGHGPYSYGGWGQHNRLIIFDPVTGVAQEDAAYPQGRIWGCQIVAAAGNVYSFGGWTGGGVSDIFRYDESSHSLVRVAGLAGGGTQIPDAVLADNGKIYLIGGNQGSGVETLINIFNPATNSCALSAARIPFPAEQSGIRVWYFGGDIIYVADTYPGPTTIWRYSISSDRFDPSPLVFTFSSLQASFPFSVKRSSGGRAFLIGGYGTEPAQPGYFIHISDIHVNAKSDNRSWHSFLELVRMQSPKPAFVVATGDLTENGWSTWGLSYRASPHWSALTAPLIKDPLPGVGFNFYVDPARTIPIYFCPGNHDLMDTLGFDMGSAAYEVNIGATFNSIQAAPNVALITLNSGANMKCDFNNILNPEGSGLSLDEYGRFASALENQRFQHKIVAMHHPYWNTGRCWFPPGPNTCLQMSDPNLDGAFMELRGPFAYQCGAYDVDLVLAGHVHKMATKGLKGICNMNAGAWQEGDGTRFVVTAALQDCYLRKIEFDQFGKITKVNKRTIFSSRIAGQVACRTDVHIHDSEGRHLGFGPDGSVEFGIPGSYFNQLEYDPGSGTEDGTLTEFGMPREDGANYEITITSLTNEPLNVSLFASTQDGPEAGFDYSGIPVVEGSVAVVRVVSGAIEPEVVVTDPDGSTTMVLPTEYWGNMPPDRPVTPSGSASLVVNETAVYSSRTQEPDGETISYGFEWGDGSESGWSDPVASGTGISSTHSWAHPGNYTVRARAKDLWGNLSAWSESMVVVVVPDTGSVSGVVAAAGTGLLGVPIDLYGTDGDLIASDASEADGRYGFYGVINGSYTVAIATPLGFQADQETKEVVVRGLPHVVNFTLISMAARFAQRGRGYWAQQLRTALDGRPKDYTGNDFARFAGLISQHFNDNRLNAVDFYTVPQPATRADSLNALYRLLVGGLGRDHDDDRKSDQAKSHLAALLLNIASGKLAQFELVSRDSVTVSQAITYCDYLITSDVLCSDEDDGDEHDVEEQSRKVCLELAKEIAEDINEGEHVEKGIIPKATLDIAYKQHAVAPLPAEFALGQNSPNPFNAGTVIRYTLSRNGHAIVTVFDILGRQVATVVDEFQTAGPHEVQWNGTDAHGQAVASGMYFYRLTADGSSQSKKMILLK